MKSGSGCSLPAQVSQLVLFVYRQTPAPAKKKIQLRVFASSWQIKVLPFRQVSDDDSCRRMNSAVMKIRLFKPKNILENRNPSQSKPSIHPG
jgi:hypothetical protein